MSPHSDNHSHIILASIQSMVEAAYLSQVTDLSVTEHISQFSFIREKIIFASFHENGRMFSSFDEYLGEFSMMKDLDGIKVRKGLEVDYIEEYESLLGREVSRVKWDTLLCSVHELPGGVDVEAKDLSQDEESSANRWKLYFLTQEKALRSNLIGSKILTHPTRLGVSTPNYPENMDEMLINLARVARRKGVALELNGNDLGRMPGLVKKVARACKVAGCTVGFGSDAHFPDQFSRGFDLALKLGEDFELNFVR